jgi:antitoxin HigA-1
MSRSSTTTKRRRGNRLPPVSPGEILREDFMVPMNLSMNRLALDLRVPTTRIAEIIHGRRSITVDTAMRLGRYFGTSTQLWLNLQMNYDMDIAKDMAATIAREVMPLRKTGSR